MFRAAFFRSESPYGSNDTQAAQTGRSDRGAATFHVARPARAEARQSAIGRSRDRGSTTQSFNGVFAAQTFDGATAAQTFDDISASGAEPRRAAFPVA